MCASWGATAFPQLGVATSGEAFRFYWATARAAVNVTETHETAAWFAAESTIRLQERPEQSLDERPIPAAELSIRHAGT
jgi:hypothetical protein